MARPADYDGGDTPAEIQRYLDELDDWEAERDRLAASQATARAELEAAEERLTNLAGWLERVRAAVAPTAERAGRLDAVAAGLDGAAAAVTALTKEVADYQAAREAATARLIGSVAATTPVVLTPVRLETQWTGRTLRVRIFPDDLNVDAHDASLTPEERQYGVGYWAAPGEAAWQQLVRRYGPQRAAWVVRATRRGASPVPTGDSVWPPGPVARLLPDRFAVVAYAGDEPVDVGEPGRPRYVTWTAPVTDGLPLGALDSGPTASWLTDFADAQAAGMAVTIRVPDTVPVIDLLAVVGVRSGDGDLGDLLSAHAYSSGLRVLADGVPTSNSDSVRAAYTAARTVDVARELVSAVADSSAAIADGSAGAELAAVLGVDRSRLVGVAGAAVPRAPAVEAMRLLVGLAATAPDTGLDWSLVAPDGPSPALGVGRQPYGVLPVTAPARWQPALPPLESVVGARRPFPELLLESASSVAYEPGFSGLAGLVGDAADYLPRIASGSTDELPPTLLARVAAIARRRADDVAAVDEALTTLAALPPADLARLLTGFLDAVSHRSDPWLTGVYAARLSTLDSRAVGAFGWVTDVAPRGGTRSHGHVHAPSIAHAATGAVLRSGFLTQQLAVDLSSSRVRAARWILAAVRAGQPLGAVLGYQFERDLAAAGLQHYLPAFRKLTRFRTGSALSQQRDDAVRSIELAQERLASLRSAAEAASAEAAAAASAVSAAAEEAAAADAQAEPHARQRDELEALTDVTIPKLEQELAEIDARKPVAGQRHYTVRVPVAN